MPKKTETCPNCSHELDPDSGLCPSCDDPAPKWLVYAVYGLLALFALGLVYRLIWP
jgi:hypothetical protein